MIMQNSTMNIQPDVNHDSIGNNDGSHGGEDFVLTGKSAWLRIDGQSLFISNRDDRLSVKLFPLGKEMEPELEGFDFWKDV
tara:strand:+ start:3166 stop:3408 length:243 start_codon:yes stop_codon:yes gene_type:complete